MPSFLNKVFGYKKHDDKEVARPTREASDNTLLDGKYEAILPIASPSASTFADAQPNKDSDRDVGFSLFRPKARGVFQKSVHKHPEDFPHLTLELPGPKGNSDSRTLGVVFEADPDSQIVLDDAVIAATRLSPLEALILVQACARAIAGLGLDTLGIMHPHWFSASLDVQRKLISIFIRSLPQTQTTTLSPTTNSSTSAFENELRYTRSPHDVAAVLRWGLRHLSLDNGHFGKDSAEWGWYNTFFLAERDASYPPDGFTKLLLPQLPASHIELLIVTLGLISSLASRAEVNGISGSKLSKFLGLWLLVAIRADQSDDWSRFYARWERSGRILEHLFLARLREESLGQRLPTRLQELVKYYPYNKGTPSMDDNLLSRPRFSTRQYDALFVRVETVLTHNTEQPKQHPIRLLLEAFQLPIDNPSGSEHIALWNTLKTTALEDPTSSNPDGLQFSRIFVDETIHLLTLIPVDNNLPTSPTLLTSPITKVVPRRRSGSFTRAFERAFHKYDANDSSTPTSPTSPFAVTDWAQFALSGFGDTPSAQPLAVLMSEDDVEVTQPQISRKSSRQSGKSRTRRRRSEDREPLDSPPSSRRDPEPSIVETKLASVHVVQIDEAFIDFWSDAITDPISASWPTFVVCGLKQTSSTEQPIHWLVIEQAYSRQEPQSSRVPSPDGRRGRSPRPSFKSDISGFRINSVFASARKRLSVFSKSATDLDLKKSGGKTPVAGELGEILVEEEATSPSAPPTQAGIHVDGNAAVGATVICGATTDTPDQLKTTEMSTVPVAGTLPAPAPKEQSSPIRATMKAPSIEPTTQSRGGNNGSLLPTPPSGRISEETISVERDSPRAVGDDNPKTDNSVNSATEVVPLAADTSNSRPARNTCDPTVLTSALVSSLEDPITEEVQVEAEQVQQGITIEADVQPIKLVAQAADLDERLHTESTSDTFNVVQADVAANDSQGDAQAIALPTPETDTVAAQSAVIAAVDDEAPEPAVEDVAEQLSLKASADPVAAFAVESDGQNVIGHLSPIEAIATETEARLEPRLVSSVVNEVEEAKEVAEVAEIPTPGPEIAVFVEDTPGREASADICGRTGAAQVSVAKPDTLDGTAPQSEVVDDATPQPVATELQVTEQAEASFVTCLPESPCIEVVLAIDSSAQVVAVETEHIADQVPEPANTALPHVQGTIIIPAAEAPLDTAPSAPEIEADVSAGIVFASQAEDVSAVKAEDQAASEGVAHEDHNIRTQDAGMPAPVPEHAALLDKTPVSEIVADAHQSVEVTPVITPESEEVETKIRDPDVETNVKARAPPIVYIPLGEKAQPSPKEELPTQVHDIRAAEALPTEPNPEASTAALATPDEVAAVKAEAQSRPDVPIDDAENHAFAAESAPVGAITEDAVGTPGTASELESAGDKATEPITEEAQVLAMDAAPSTSEHVAITPIVTIEEPVVEDVQAPIRVDDPSSESAPQSAEEATNPTTLVISVPEEITAVEVEAREEPDVVHPMVDTVDEPLVEHVPAAVEVEESSAAVEVSGEAVTIPSEVPAVEINETAKGDEPQRVVDLAEHPATTTIDA